jgi:hypothetical protein
MGSANSICLAAVSRKGGVGKRGVWSGRGGKEGDGGRLGVTFHSKEG